MKRGAIAALAAVLLVGSAAAVGVSQGWLHFFSSEEEVLQAAMAGTEDGTAGYGIYGGADYENLQSIQEMADAALYFATAPFTTGQVLAVHGGFGLGSPVYGDMLLMNNKR